MTAVASLEFRMSFRSCNRNFLAFLVFPLAEERFVLPPLRGWPLDEEFHASRRQLRDNTHQELKRSRPPEALEAESEAQNTNRKWKQKRPLIMRPPPDWQSRIRRC